MQLAHPADQDFVGFVVGEDAERRIFFAESLQRFAHLVPVAASLGADGDLDHRIGNEHRFQRAEVSFGGVRITAGRIDPHHGDDVAGRGRFDFLALVAVHSHDAAEPLFARGPLVDVRFAFADRALINPHEGQLAERIVDDLERHADERCVGIRLQLDPLVFVLGIPAADFAIQRAGQEASDRVEHRLDAFVLERSSHVDRGGTAENRVAG